MRDVEDVIKGVLSPIPPCLLMGPSGGFEPVTYEFASSLKLLCLQSLSLSSSSRSRFKKLKKTSPLTISSLKCPNTKIHIKKCGSFLRVFAQQYTL